MYAWSSITDIYLSRKENYESEIKEATSIIFDSGDKLNIWQDVYSNCEEMRSYISQKAAGKIRDLRPDYSLKSVQAMTKRRYAGNVYTSFNTLLAVGIAIFLILSFKQMSNSEMFLLIPAGLSLLLFLGTGTQMNYFLIDEGYLFIRNHYFPWINKRIRLDDIVEADVETPTKRSSGLRIITKDFGSHLYGAGSLRDSNWDDLLGDLNLIGIPVRDDR